VIGKHWQPWVRGLPVLGIIWLVEAVGDRLWFAFDHAIPSWDQAEYLTGALNYWRAFQTPHWFSADWWTSLWQLSSKIPPLVYISTAPFLSLFGAGPDQSTLVNLLYSAILLGSVYALGVCLFNLSVGLWAAGLCVMLPGLYQVRLDYLLDYPLAAMVILSFTLLTVWRNRGQGAGSREQGAEEEGEVKNEKVQGQSSIFNLQSPLPKLQSQIFNLKSSIFNLQSLRSWLIIVAFGVAFGLALMVKQPALLFLLMPLVWVGVETVWKRNWLQLVQLTVALGISFLVFCPWFRTNWLLTLSSSKRATIDSAIAEGDPSLLSLDAWTYYLKVLPSMVSLPLLLVGLAGIVLFWRRSRVSSQWLDKPDYAPMSRDFRQKIYAATQQSLLWLLVFCLGGYLFSSLNINKDERYVVPYLPAIAVILAYGFTLLPRRWRGLRWGTVGLSAVLMIYNVLPISVGGTKLLRDPIAYHPAYIGPEYPHSQVAAEVIQTEPYLRSTIGVLPSTVEVNQHNVNYYGNLKNFQVYGRQVGTRLKDVEKDGRSLNWFIMKTGDQGSIRKPDAHDAIVQQVEFGGDFQLHKTWLLPDSSTLKLFHRQVSLLEISPVGKGVKQESGVRGQGSGLIQNSKFKIQNSPTPDSRLPTSPIALDEIIVPKQSPAGKPIPVTYRWSGSWESLQSGLVMLTWRNQAKTKVSESARWFHDHGIGIGSLYPAEPSPSTPTKSELYQVTERMAMLPPTDLAPGTYTLEAIYMNRKSGETTSIAVPPVSLQIDPSATPTPAPELDLVTQLRSLAAALPEGNKGLSRIFDEVGRINQYDPMQDYLTQARQAAEYRLKQDPSNLEFAYALALSNVLKRRVNPALAALETVTKLDPKNPNAYGYLAFVNLYDFRPGAAKQALSTALKLNPNLPELQALSGVASLMQGNLGQAWQHIQTYQKLVRK